MEQSNKSMDPFGYDLNSLISRDFEGLAGVETASGYWGISSYGYMDNVILLFQNNDRDNNGHMVEYHVNLLSVPNVNHKNIVKITEHFHVTDPEQTVCDMVRYNRHEFHLYETVMNAYETGIVDVDRMEKLAEQYGILDRLREIYKLACQEYEECDG